MTLPARIRVPATVANLGPGFDALGVAVRMHLEIEIEPRQTMSRDADIRGMTLMNADEKELNAIHAALFAGMENKDITELVTMIERGAGFKLPKTR